MLCRGTIRWWGVNGAFSLRNLQPVNLERLGYTARWHALTIRFWLAVYDACEAERLERQKPQSERQKVTLRLPAMLPEERSLVRDELAEMDRQCAEMPDEILVKFLKTVGASLDEPASVRVN